MFKSIYVFDAYGTLFDVNSAARIASAEPDFPELAAHWPAVAANWRRKQLEYTWLRAVSGRHADFEQVTKDGLDWTLEAAKLTSPALRERLLALYWELDAYPEVTAMLARLKAAGARTAILSNGTPEMLAAAVTSAGITEYLDAVLSIESVGVYQAPRHRLRHGRPGIRLRKIRRPVCLVQRLGCSGRLWLRLYNRMGEPRGRSRRQAICHPAPHFI